MTEQENPFGLTGKKALVTGGGSGLGRGFVLAMLKAGAAVAAADREEERAGETARLAGEAGFDCLALTSDVSDPEQVETMVTTAHEALGGIDILVNSAGIAAKGVRAHELAIEDWMDVININLTGTYFCCRSVLPLMLAANGGSIINIASISGLIGHYPGFPMLTAAYAASKAGVNGMTKQMAVEYAADNIRVNAIAPGWHGGTRLAEKNKASMTNAEIAAFEDSIRDGTPMGRRSDPDELANLAVYLASDAAAFMTGQVIAHDGGWTAQ